MAASAEYLPSGRVSSKRLEGGVGDRLERRARDPGLADERRADEVDGHAVALQHHVSDGNASPPCDDEDRRARQRDGQQRCADGRGRSRRRGASRGVGFELRGRARLLQRRQPRGQLLGEIHLDARDVRLRCPAARSGRPASPSGSRRCFACFPDVETANFGANSGCDKSRPGSGWRSPRVRPLGARRGPRERLRVAVGRVEHEPGRSITASTARRSVGTPSTICGSGSVVIVICAVYGSTSIFALVTIVPRLNGPATPASRSTGRTARPCRAREIDRRFGLPRLGDHQRVRAGAGVDDRVPDVRGRRACALGCLRFVAERDLEIIPARPGRRP